MPDRLSSAGWLVDQLVMVASDGRVVAPTAIVAMGTPWWLPLIAQAHDIAAMILPILGSILAVLQIAAVLIRKFK